MEYNKEIIIVAMTRIETSFHYERALEDNKEYFSEPIQAHFHENDTHHFALWIKESEEEPYFYCFMVNREYVGISMVPCDYPHRLPSSDLYMTLKDAFELAGNFQHMKEDRV